MRIAVAGCAGRMGQALVRKILATPGVQLGGGSERVGNALVGQEVGSSLHVPTPGVLITTEPEELFLASDAVIDFTTPDYSVKLAELAAGHKRIHVCGTTAMKDNDLALMRKYADKARIVYSPNMSIGVNLLLGMV